MEIDSVKEILDEIGVSYFYENGEKIRIIDFVNENEKIQKQALDKMNSYQKFCRFVSSILIRNQKGTFKEGEKKYYKSDILEDKLLNLNINDKLWKDKEYLEKLVRESRINYGRFKESAGDILFQAKQIFNQEFNQEFSPYIKQAKAFFQQYQNENVPTRYFGDNFITISGVKYKTRDLGLSTLINSVISIDQHLMRIPLLLDIYKLSNIPEEIWKKGQPGSDANYFRLARFLLPLSYKLDITPWKFDRILWKFATEVCTEKNPKCNNCSVRNCKRRK